MGQVILDDCQEDISAAILKFVRQGADMVLCTGGMSVDPATAAATREYNGTTYYFCNPGCAAKFEQNPTQYLA